MVGFYSPETHFSNSTVTPHTSQTDGLQQAWINSRNLTNIATPLKHRQLIFLHPTVTAEKAAMARELAGLLSEKLSSPSC